MSEAVTTTTPPSGTSTSTTATPKKGDAAATSEKADAAPVETGAHGIALPVAGEHGGGDIKAELKPEPPVEETRDPLWKQRRYMKSKLAAEAGQIIGRAPADIGLWGKGDTYRGTGIVIDVDSMEKVRVYAEYKFDDDHVYANIRDLPPALVDGDVSKNLTGKA
jgi:hypothetical protein